MEFAKHVLKLELVAHTFTRLNFLSPDAVLRTCTRGLTWSVSEILDEMSRLGEDVDGVYYYRFQSLNADDEAAASLEGTGMAEGGGDDIFEREIAPQEEQFSALCALQLQAPPTYGTRLWRA